MAHEIDTMKAFAVGFAIGSLVSGYLGFHFGRRMSKGASRPEFRVVIASIIVAIWAIAQIISLAFGTAVDPWLNAIMGAVAGFLFGDGLVESIKSKGK